jgi:hypothetical protein
MLDSYFELYFIMTKVSNLDTNLEGHFNFFIITYVVNLYTNVAPGFKTKPDTHHMWDQEVKSHIRPQIRGNIKRQYLIYNVFNTKRYNLRLKTAVR